MSNYYESKNDHWLGTVTQAYRSQAVPDGPPEEFVAGLLEALRRAEEGGHQPVIINPGKTMLVRMTRRTAVAATVLIAGGGLMAWLTAGGGTTLAFADVAEALANIRTATWDVRTEVETPDGKTTVNGKAMYLAPSLERQECPDTETRRADGHTMTGVGSVIISDYQSGETLTLWPTTKRAMFLKYENLPADSPGNLFELLRTIVSDVQAGKVGKVRGLGKQNIDGREVAGLHVSKGDYAFEIWANPKSGLPVRVEFTTIRFKPKTRVVMSDFRSNVELEKSLFSFDVPEGYTLISRLELDATEPRLEDLVQLLREVATHNEGLFPTELASYEAIHGPMLKSALAKYGAGESPEREKALAEFGAQVVRGMEFVRNLTPENDWSYAGKAVKINTPNRPVFWYKPAGSDKYRVLYADLTIKPAAPDDLPRLIDGDSVPETATATETGTVTTKRAVTKSIKVNVDANGKITIEDGQ